MKKDLLTGRLDAVAASSVSLLSQEQPAPAPDWLVQLLGIDRGDVIGTDITAMILNCHLDMARKRAVDAFAISVANPVWNLEAGTA
jgi:hypothetical protein